MLRVIATIVMPPIIPDDAYEGLSVKPEGIDAGRCPDYLLKAACHAWDNAFAGRERHGFRNAQVSVIAPTGRSGWSWIAIRRALNRILVL